MDISVKKDKLDLYRTIIKVLSVVTICLSVALIILAGTSLWAFKNKMVILTPPVLTQQLSMNSVRPNSDYLATMSLFLIDQKLNISPGDVDMKYNIFKKYVSPSAYHSVSLQLDNDKEAIKKHKISSTFHADGTAIDKTNQLKVYVPGTLEKWVGYGDDSRHFPQEKITYVLEYHYNNGTLTLLDLYKLPPEKQG
jgi:type IV conjugative transfer system protein TraE